MRLAITAALLLLALMLLGAAAFAHEGEEHETAVEDVTHQLKSVDVVLGGMAAVLVLVGLAAHYKSRMSRREQKAVFAVIAIVVLSVTVYLLATTLLLNALSATGGPVHWHADFEVWACGEQLELAGPEGFSNKVGEELLHHHDDMRMHIEGVVLDLQDVSLGRFFEAIGGSLSDTAMSIQTHHGAVSYRNGDACPGGAGEVQVFVYKASGSAGRFVFEQEKLSDAQSYVISPFSAVPPGDCVIVEFDVPKSETDKMCDTYEAELAKGAAVMSEGSMR